MYKLRKDLKVEWEKTQPLEEKENYALKKKKRLGSAASKWVHQPG